MAPHRCPYCEDIPDDIFPLPPYSVTNPDPPPHYDDLFPLVTPHSLTPTPTYASVSLQYPSPSIPLDPPPPYDSLFATAAPPDCAVAPQISLIIEVTLIHGILILGQTGTCSSSPPSPPYLIFFYIFNTPA